MRGDDRREKGEMNYLHIDFSMDTHQVEIQDLLSGQVYSTEKNLLREHAFGKELSDKRSGISYESASIEHWLKRGWDASLPLYMSSRHIKFVDSGTDRAAVLERLFDSYSVSQNCPVLVRHTLQTQSILLELIGSDSIKWNQNYQRGMLDRRSKRTFQRKALDKKRFISIVENAVARLFETIHSKSTVSETERYTKSYGCAFNIYLLVYSVSNLAAGIYIVDKDHETLTFLQSGNFSAEMSAVNWGMRAPLTANYSVALTVDPSVYAWRYRHDRSFRNLMVEAGRIMHEFVLSASGVEIQGVVTPATDDKLLSRILGIPEHSQEIPFYTGTFGVSPRGL